MVKKSRPKTLWQKLQKQGQKYLRTCRKQVKRLSNFDFKKFKFPKLSLQRLGRPLFILFGVILTLLIIFMTAVLRNQQLCGFEALSQRDLLQDTAGVECANLLDLADYGKLFGQSVWARPTNAYGPTSYPVNSDFMLANFDDQDLTECKDLLNPLCWVTKQPKLKKKGGYTNLLLVGLDSREGQNIKNTDTILLVSFNHNSGDLLFISFPRDIYLSYYRPNNYRVTGRINAVYANDGIKGLNYVVEQVSGRPIHYYAYVDFTAFEKAIKAVGGVTLRVPETFYDYYPCIELPENMECPERYHFFDGWYGKFTFKKGQRKLNPLRALVYARARKLTSDFGRARRQQDIAKALIRGLVEDDSPVTDKVQKYLDLYQIFRSDIQTNVQPKDVAGIIALLDKVSNKSANIVADPNLGSGYGDILVQNDYIDGVGYSISFNDETYQEFQNHIADTWKYLPFYIERPKVRIVNRSGKKLPNNSAILKLINRQGDYLNKKVIKKSDPQKILAGGIRLYSFNQNKTSSIIALNNSLPGSLIFDPRVDELQRTKFKEDILILIGSEGLRK